MSVGYDVKLTGKVAIVTGGSGTLCSVMAKALANCGAKVAIVGRDKEKAEAVAKQITDSLSDSEGIVLGYSCDVCDKVQLEMVYEQIKAELGSCDILINGAGGNRKEAITVKENIITADMSAETASLEMSDFEQSLWGLAEQSVDEVMELNYKGTLLPIMVFTKEMIKKQSGSIINISSVAGVLPLTKVVTYSNAKSAIVNLTQWLAVHLGTSGVRCNAIAPGFYDAVQNHDLLFNEDGSLKPRAEKILNNTPMGRFGEPKDLAGAAVFLASEEMSGFINGVVLPVDGGFLAYSGV